MIDKETEKWKNLPWWFRANMFGVNSRRHVLIVEFTLLLLAFASWVFFPSVIATSTAFFAVYLTGWIVRYGDKNDAW